MLFNTVVPFLHRDSLSAAGQDTLQYFSSCYVSGQRMGSAHGSIVSSSAPIAPASLWSAYGARHLHSACAVDGMRSEANQIRDPVLPLRVARLPARRREQGQEPGAGAELVSSPLQLPLQSGAGRALFTRTSFAFEDGIACQPVNLRCHIRLPAFHIGSHAGFCPLHEIDLGARGSERNGPTPHDHIAVQWHVCPARARSEGRDLFHAVQSRVKSASSSFPSMVVFYPQLPTSYASRANGRVDSPGNAWDPPRSKWPGMCRSYRLCRDYSFALQLVKAQLSTSTPWPRRVLCPHSFRCCFFWGKPSAYFRALSSPQEPTPARCTSTMAVKMMGVGQFFYFHSVCPPLTEAGLDVLVWVGETVQYIGQRLQTIRQSSNSLHFRVKVVTLPYSLPPLTGVPAPKPCAFPSLQTQLVRARRSPTLRVGSLAVRKGHGGNATCSGSSVERSAPRWPSC